jgi:hypothetical protein
MKSRVQELAEKINMPYAEFVGEIRKRGCSESTALKIWHSDYETFDDFMDNDINLSNLQTKNKFFKTVSLCNIRKEY